MNRIQANDILTGAVREFLVPMEPPSAAETFFRQIVERQQGFVSDSEGRSRACVGLEPESVVATGSVSPSWFDSERYYTFDSFPLRVTIVSMSCANCGTKGRLVIRGSMRREIALSIECNACGAQKDVEPPPPTSARP